jgi:hypothetical protein
MAFTRNGRNGRRELEEPASRRPKSSFSLEQPGVAKEIPQGTSLPGRQPPPVVPSLRRRIGKFSKIRTYTDSKSFVFNSFLMVTKMHSLHAKVVPADAQN